MEYVYPHQEINQGYANEPVNRGLSLRDYFAGQAIVGILANPETERTHQEAEKDNPGLIEQWPSVISKAAYEIADAMIETRNHSIDKTEDKKWDK